MRSKRSHLLALVLLIVIPISILVGSRLRWSVSRNFLWVELEAVGEPLAILLKDLCSPRILAGLEKPRDVAADASTSLLYVVPTKLLWQKIDVLTLHRALAVLLFFAGLAILAAALVRLELDPFLIASGLVYYGLSAQYVSLLFDGLFLTLSSAFWLALAIFVFASLSVSEQQGARTALGWMFIVPLTAALAFETYIVARPLAIVYVAFVFGWAALRPGWKRRRAFLGCGVIGCALAFCALHVAHPEMRFDLSLFRGAGEAIVDNTGQVTAGATSEVTKRLQELPHLLDWPYRKGFTSRIAVESGWRDVWIVLAALLGLILLVSLTRRRKEIWEEGKRLFWPAALLTVLGFTALLIPLGAVTYVRGYRLFGLYMTSVALAVVLGQLLVRSGLRLLRYGLPAAALLAIGVVAWGRVPAIEHWTASGSAPSVWTIIHSLRDISPPADLTIAPDGVVLAVHDQEAIPGAYFLAAIYVSDFACRFHVKELGGVEHVDCQAPDAMHRTIYRMILDRVRDGDEYRMNFTYCVKG